MSCIRPGMPELLLHVFQCSFALSYRPRRVGSPENLEVQFFEFELLTDRIEHSRLEVFVIEKSVLAVRENKIPVL